MADPEHVALAKDSSQAIGLEPLLMERNRADFCDPSKYEKALERLLRGLRRRDNQGQ